MKFAIIMRIIKFLYNRGGREALEAYIDNPATSWDDHAMGALDELLR